MAALLLLGLLLDGSFLEWDGEAPRHWQVAVGARSGEGAPSILERGEEGGVLLRGDAGTGVWRMLTQRVALEAGATYRLSFQARAVGLVREPRQFDNAYVGVRLGDAAPSLDQVLAAEWAPGEVIFREGGGGTAEVAIFLSKTGAMEVRALLLEKVAPEESFDLLVRNMDRYYSHFHAKRIDWASLAARHREAALAAAGEEAFLQALLPMLRELKDLHVSIRGPSGPLLPTFGDAPARNVDYAAVTRGLAEVRRIGKIALAGDLGEGLGYLGIVSLQGTDAQFRELGELLAGMRECRGILLDLRANGGGDERRAAALAAFFADKPRLYATARTRSGARHDQFGPPMERWIAPQDEGGFLRPVVCLIGPYCVSSGEGFAKMMAVMPHVTMAGKATRGASGNPAPVPLPNGVEVWFSRWSDSLPDGTATEGRGLAPQVELEGRGDGDATFRAGVELLRRRVGEATER
ncbi:MAG: S41 family peptidase [Planctomycetaceae bacterium]